MEYYQIVMLIGVSGLGAGLVIGAFWGARRAMLRTFQKTMSEN